MEIYNSFTTPFSLLILKVTDLYSTSTVKWVPNRVFCVLEQVHDTAAFSLACSMIIFKLRLTGNKQGIIIILKRQLLWNKHDLNRKGKMKKIKYKKFNIKKQTKN